MPCTCARGNPPPYPAVRPTVSPPARGSSAPAADADLIRAACLEFSDAVGDTAVLQVSDRIRVHRLTPDVEVRIGVKIGDRRDAVEKRGGTGTIQLDRKTVVLQRRGRVPTDRRQIARVHEIDVEVSVLQAFDFTQGVFGLD